MGDAVGWMVGVIGGGGGGGRIEVPPPDASAVGLVEWAGCAGFRSSTRANKPTACRLHWGQLNGGVGRCSTKPH